MTEDNQFMGQAPLSLSEMLALADIDEAAIDAAVDWWDEHASDLFWGALEAGSEQ